MKKLIRSLGNFVQTLWNKIFGKKKKKAEDIIFGAGTIFINNESFGEVKQIKMFNKEDISTNLRDNLISVFGDGETNTATLEILPEENTLEKFFNIPLTFLPKPYWCETLLVTVAANQESDYQAVDMSQYEEKKLAHFIIGRKDDWDKIFEEYWEDEPEEEEDSALLELGREDGFLSVYIGKATLYHYEDLGLWYYEAEDEEE